MGRFLLGRTVQMAVTLLVVVTLVFVVATVVPGDPVRVLFGIERPPPEIYDAIVAQYHLDEPLLQQYLLYLGDLLTGDLGRSFPSNPYGDITAGAPINGMVAAAAPHSARILLGALALQTVVGIAVGVRSALRPTSRSSRSLYALALALVSTPVLVAAFVSREIVGVELQWLPSGGLNDGWLSYVLPAMSLAALSTGSVALLSRSELRDSLREPYIRAARARGLAPQRIVGVHALRASLVPVVTFIAADVGTLVTGLVIVESIFGITGVGGMVLQAILSRNRALIIGLVIVIATAVIVANTVADILHAVIDPRVRSRI